MHGDVTYEHSRAAARMVEFAERMADDPQGLNAEAGTKRRSFPGASRQDARPRRPRWLRPVLRLLLQHRPVLEPGQFGEFVTPYLAPS